VNLDSIRRRQQLLHEVNEAIAEITVGWNDQASHFLCECGREGCSRTIRLDMTEFRDVHTREDLYVVSPGHAVPGLDVLETERAGYDVVRVH
jgi:hypothetical protein